MGNEVLFSFPKGRGSKQCVGCGIQAQSRSKVSRTPSVICNVNTIQPSLSRTNEKRDFSKESRKPIDNIKKMSYINNINILNKV